MSNLNYNFRINNLPPFSLGDIARSVASARNSGRDVIDLSQLNPNLTPPGVAVEKLVQASLQPQNHKYSSSQGISKLRQSFTAWYARKFNVNLDSEAEVVVTIGTKEGLSHLLLATVTPSSTILIPTPAYPIHTASIILAGAHLIGVPLLSENDSLQSQRVETLTDKSDDFFKRLVTIYEATWPRPIMMILSFPHNPTTTVVELSFFERLVALAKELGIFLIHDFAYADVCFDGYVAPSILEVEGAKDIAVEFCSLSKGASMPGWRIGICAGNPQLVGALKKIKSFFDCGVFQPLQIAAIKAVEQYDSFVMENVDEYKSRRDTLVQGLNQIGWTVEKPLGSLFLWARIPEKYRKLGSLKFANMLLEKNVAVCPGVGFDMHCDEYVRFAFVENDSRIRNAVDNISEFFK
ncbi:MAG: aminotransferase class I/II-fold pyridoxal phosphate-dependent enzyme [Proteobacteria bacterium]|nr:aminotransferase class I/II-fold pyridoxal phosphate-dependent enzyme [Pseudomonadota bacterium]